VKTAIKGYYGDTLTSAVDPVPNAVDGGDKVLHTFDPNGAYANERAGVVDDATKYLRKPNAGSGTGTKAVLFDVDDTTLNTYNYEIYSNFVYSPTTNAAFVNAGVFPAVPHMVDLEHYAEQQGYTVFFLTGRPGTQRDGTVANLTNVGYDVVSSNLYLKDYAVDTWLSSCAPTCTTIQYKSLTRQHIESLGYDIVANFGDQFSDLTGGFADETFKIPNPMYYLP
jgi:predicted secreted acid phosphatase